MNATRVAADDDELLLLPLQRGGIRADRESKDEACLRVAACMLNNKPLIEWLFASELLDLDTIDMLYLLLLACLQL